MAVTGRDGWAEVEFPFGMVVASAGRRVEESWVGADQVVELTFHVRAREVQQVGRQR
jgi:hypothetical protein